MIDHDAAPEDGGRIDVDPEDERHAGLEMQRQKPPPRLEQRMRQPVGLDGVEALEEEQRLEGRQTGGVAVEDGGEVGAGGGADLRMRRHELGEDLAQQHRRDRLGAELLGQDVGERVLEASLAQHARLHEARERRLLGRQGGRGVADVLPDRIVGSEPGEGLRHGGVSEKAKRGRHTTAGWRRSMLRSS